MEDIRPPEELLLAVTQHDTRTEELGVKLGKLYTDQGFPLDMALDKLTMPESRKLIVLNSALGWLVQHKRNSGASEKALDRQRKANRQTIDRFIKTKETGLY